MQKEFKIIRQDTVYQGFFRLIKYQLKHTLFGGGWSTMITRELFIQSNGVAVLLYDPYADKVVLIEQFRAGAIFNPDGAWLVEIIAGAVKAEESATEVAYRESLEEAGCEIKELILIKKFYTTPGAAAEKISLFCGKVDTSNIGGIHGLDDENEDILVTTVKFDEIFNKGSISNKIESGIAIIAIQWLAMHRDELRKKWMAN